MGFAPVVNVLLNEYYPNCLYYKMIYMGVFFFHFPDTTFSVIPLSLQMIFWSHRLMKRESTVFSKAIFCCSAAQDLI